MTEEFIGEQLRPLAGSFDAAGMSHGQPGLPHRFTWRGRQYALAGVIRQWKTSGPCRHGSGEMYLRRHWFEIVAQPCNEQQRRSQEQEARSKASGEEQQRPGRKTEASRGEDRVESRPGGGGPAADDAPIQLVIYCDRQAHDHKHPKRRWWVYSVVQTRPPDSQP